MKSNKQRRKEIKAKRAERVKKLRQKRVESTENIDVYTMPDIFPPFAVVANHHELGHNNTYGALPFFYVDRSFVCKHCGTREVWKAKQQKWWFEIAKGHIDSHAVQCAKCRSFDQALREEQKRHMEAMANREPHPNEAFFNKKYGAN